MAGLLSFFSLSRAVGQGYPLSLYLFILCAEALGNAAWKDKIVHGINLAKVECKLSQYADDTPMIRDGTEPCAGQRRQYGCHEDFSSSSSVTMSPFRKTYNARKFA